MNLRWLLSRARYLALLFPLHGLFTASAVGCGAISTDEVSTSSALYGAFGKGARGHAGYYGYYGCSDGYGYDDPTYGIGCDKGRYGAQYGYGYGVAAP